MINSNGWTMRHFIFRTLFFLTLIILSPSLCGKTLFSPGRFVSINVPSHWLVGTDQDDRWEALVVSTDDPLSVKFLIQIKTLSANEMQYDNITLLETALDMKMKQAKDGGGQIIEYGKYPPLYDEASTVNTTYLMENGEEFLSVWYTIVQGKLYTFTFVAQTEDGSEELANIMSELVNSVEIHPQLK